MAVSMDTRRKQDAVATGDARREALRTWEQILACTAACERTSSRQDTPMLSAVTLPSGQHILKLCPLVAWTKGQVWRYILEHQLPYNPLHDLGYASIGCTHCTRPVAAGEDERAGRWAGTAKRECGLHLAPGPVK